MNTMVTRLDTRFRILTRATGFTRDQADIAQLTAITTLVIHSRNYFENARVMCWFVQKRASMPKEHTLYSEDIPNVIKNTKKTEFDLLLR